VSRRRWTVPLVALVLGSLAVAAIGHADRPGGRSANGPHTPRVHAVAAASAARALTIGRSVQGRPVVARQLGDPLARRVVLVIGCIHGDEPAGIAITRSLRAASLPPGVALWLVDTVNPDGLILHTRQNADGVDLNRTFPVGWHPLPGTFDSGRRPLAEPESQAIHRLVVDLHPAITIWYHQHAALVDDSAGSPAIERGYARQVGLPLRDYGILPGSITRWQNATYSRDTAFVVELPAGRFSKGTVERHANAVLTLAAG
jgi:murein peptide amidase A